MPDRDVFRTVLATIEFILVLTSFLSNCFSDLAVFENEEYSNFHQDFDETQPLLLTMPSNENKLSHTPVSNYPMEYFLIINLMFLY